jgi:environmental stress-induced protein Ves
MLGHPVGLPRRIIHLSTNARRRMPWKNGRGVTEELAVWPPEACFERNDYDWRISTARIEAAGAFSSFPSMDRTLVVIGGPGISLFHGEERRPSIVRRLEPHRFPGDEPTTSKLIDGPVTDLNVLVKRGKCVAAVEVLSLGKRCIRTDIGGSEAAHAFLYLSEGLLDVRVTREEQPFRLRRGEALWAQNVGASEELELSGRVDDTIALIVRITSEVNP